MNRYLMMKRNGEDEEDEIVERNPLQSNGENVADDHGK